MIDTATPGHVHDLRLERTCVHLTRAQLRRLVVPAVLRQHVLRTWLSMVYNTPRPGVLTLTCMSQGNLPGRHGRTCAGLCAVGTVSLGGTDSKKCAKMKAVQVLRHLLAPSSLRSVVAARQFYSQRHRKPECLLASDQGSCHDRGSSSDGKPGLPLIKLKRVNQNGEDAAVTCTVSDALEESRMDLTPSSQ